MNVFKRIAEFSKYLMPSEQLHVRKCLTFKERQANYVSRLDHLNFLQSENRKGRIILRDKERGEVNIG